MHWIFQVHITNKVVVVVIVYWWRDEERIERQGREWNEEFIERDKKWRQIQEKIKRRDGQLYCLVMLEERKTFSHSMHCEKLRENTSKAQFFFPLKERDGRQCGGKEQHWKYLEGMLVVTSDKTNLELSNEDS